MDITWLGHSCFRVRGNGGVVLTDPFPLDIGLKVSTVHADVVTVSNRHPNHSATELVDGSPQVLNGPGEYEVNGFYVKGVGTPLMLDDCATWNTLFLVEIDGMMVCHLGDLAQPLTARQVEAVGAPDVLLVPVGGKCTITPTQAAEIVNRMAPQIVIPMHYDLPGLRVELEPLTGFLREMGLKDVSTQPKFSATRTTLPSDVRVVVLEPQGLM